MYELVAAAVLIIALIALYVIGGLLCLFGSFFMTDSDGGVSGVISLVVGAIFVIVATIMAWNVW